MSNEFENNRTLKILIVLANYYRDASDDLLKGATSELDKYKKFKRPKSWKTSEFPFGIFFEGIGREQDLDSEYKLTYEIRYAPGVFEIPVMISGNIEKFHSFLALGCVIKGETPHFDFISKAAINGIMNLSINHKKPIMNGIITCLNKKQAKERADPKKKDKGGEAARAFIHLWGIDK